jgi:steroid 5-alpha reductase family enzyme
MGVDVQTWLERMASDAPPQQQPPSSWLDKAQRNTQRNELDGTNTPGIVFWLLTASQIPVVTLLAWCWEIPQLVAHFSMASHAFGSVLSWFVVGDAMFFDVWGEVSIAIAFVISYWQVDEPTPRQRLCTFLAAVWVARLGGFLGWRILVRGWDWRFAKLMDGLGYNMFCFVCQGTWIFLQCCPIFAMHSASIQFAATPLGAIDMISVVITFAGLTIEHVADMQKSAFNSSTTSDQHKTWIQSGLWRYSRHPNYFGENLSWVGMGLACWGALPGSTCIVCFVAPIWSWFFLVFTSLSLLEKRLDKKFGGRPDYEQYKRDTSCLILWPVGWSWTGPRKDS